MAKEENSWRLWCEAAIFAFVTTFGAAVWETATRRSSLLQPIADAACLVFCIGPIAVMIWRVIQKIINEKPLGSLVSGWLTGWSIAMIAFIALWIYNS